MRKLWLLVSLSLLIFGCSGTGGSGTGYKANLNENVIIPNEVSKGFVDTADNMASHLMTHYAIANAGKKVVVIVSSFNNQTGSRFDERAYKEKLLDILNSKSPARAKFIDREGAEKADFRLLPALSNVVPDKIDEDLKYYVLSLRIENIATGSTVWGDQKEFTRTEIKKKKH